jgi:hypothetical protein
LAQFGNRLVEASARKLSTEFFQRFSDALRDSHGQQLSGAQQRGLSGRAIWFSLKNFVQRVLIFKRK